MSFRRSPSSIALLLVLSYVHLPHGVAGAAAHAPCQSLNGVLECTLRVEVADVHLNFKNISFRTRTYNGMVPGPLMRAAPGDHVRILLQNRLESNAPGSGCHAHPAEFRAVNSTNLHIHGIYDSSSADNTFVCLEPGSDYLYNYHLDSRTGTSTLWYHPHMDGSSAMQLYGGMAGAFEIVDAKQDAAHNLTFSQTRVLVLQLLSFDSSGRNSFDAYMSNKGSSALPFDLRNPENYTGTILLVNGEVAPSLALAAGQFARLKLINAMSGGANNVNFGFVGTAAESCQLYVLAYDGVYLSAPRMQRSVFIPSGGKTDIAVSCGTSGRHIIGTSLDGVEGLAATIADSLVVLALEVQDGATRMNGDMVSLPSTLPGPPSYYADLSHTRPDMYHTIRMSDMKGGNDVDGVSYNHTVSYTMPHGSVQEWRIEASEGTGFLMMHSYHQHFTHFQIMQVSLDNAVVATVGDYRDTVVLYRDLNYTIRFVAPFQGLMMIHCHVLKHEDLGMMTLANITGTSASLAAFSRAPIAIFLGVLLGGGCMLGLALAYPRGKESSACGCYQQFPGGNIKETKYTNVVSVLGVSQCAAMHNDTP